MKICAAQTRPVTGDIQANIGNHKKLIEPAISHGADIIIFPELSLTGYEPKLANELATDQEDSRLDDFQQISNSRAITISIGLTKKNEAGICISMVLFQPQQPRRTYSKKYIHPDEEPFFICGNGFTGLKVKETKIALAICYELSVPEHSANAYRNGADIYMASVAKFASGVDKAMTGLSAIARNYSMTVLMANSVGPADGDECVGKTSVWNHKGILTGQLDDASEGILIIDTGTQELIEKTI